MSLKDKLGKVLESERTARLDKIEVRACTSDNYDGAEYKFYGDFIPVMPLVDAIADINGKAIEQMWYKNEGEDVCFCMFVADLPEQTHPAFVEL